MFESFLQDRRHRAALIAAAEAKGKVLADRRVNLEQTHEMKLKRQVELWTIFNLVKDSEEEYFNVTRTVANLVKEIAAIDEYTTDLHSASNVCRDEKQCESLEQLLNIEDPWLEKIKQGTQDALPRVMA